MVEMTFEETKEELRREKVNSALSNKTIVKLLSEKKTQKQESDEKIEKLTKELEDSLKKQAGMARELAENDEILKSQQDKLSEMALLLAKQDPQREKSLFRKLRTAETRVLELEQQLVGSTNIKLPRNPRGAGRKKVATPETIELVLRLRETGVSYVKISEVLKERLGVELGRTTVGDIVRGKYQPSTESA